MLDTSISLIHRLRDTADQEAWQRLVDLYAPLLQRWCRTYDVQPTDADDLVQEVLATISQELPKFEHNERPGAFRAWLRAILVNRLRRFWQQRAEPTIATGGTSALQRLNELASESSAASRAWDAEHDQHVLAWLLRTIEPRFLPKTWEAFRRQVLAGERADQVAAELAMPLSSVYVARNRVLSALRREAAGMVDTA